MTKSIISGGVMLVAALSFLVGITGIANMTSAALVSWGALFAVAFILFAAFGGFKPFFLPTGHEPAPDGGAPGSTNLEGQDQAINRRLVTVGAEDEAEGHPLFEDRPPVVSQPKPTGNPLFDDASGLIESSESPPKPTGFGDALGERLAGDRDESHFSDGPVSEVASEVVTDVPAPDTVAVADLSPTLVTEAAPWVAARNEALLDQSPSPHIEVEESPSWMHSSDDETTQESEARDEVTEEASADVAIDEAAPQELDAAEAGVESEIEASLEVDTSSDTAADAHGDDAVRYVDTADIEVADTPPASEAEAAETESTDSESADAEAELVQIESQGAVDELAIAEQNGSAQLPVVVTPPAPLELHNYSPSEIMAVVRTQESELVDNLIDEGVLTTSGPITDRDVRTMLFVAVSSNELIDVLTAASGDENTAAVPGQLNP